MNENHVLLQVPFSFEATVAKRTTEQPFILTIEFDVVVVSASCGINFAAFRALEAPSCQ